MSRLPVAGPVVIPGVVQVTVHWLCGTRNFTNVLHGNYTGTTNVSPTMAETLFTAFKSGMTSSGWQGFMGTACSMRAVGIKDLRAPNLAEQLSTGTALPGTSAEPEISAGSALVVTLRTGKSGREFRGRVFLGGLTQGVLVSAFDAVDAANSAATALVQAQMTAMSANAMPMVVAQRALQAGTDKKGNPLPPRAAGFTIVTGTAIVNPRIDSQRRRLGR